MLQYKIDTFAPVSALYAFSHFRSAADHLKKIIDITVSQVFAIDPIDLNAPSRGQARVALARQTAMYLAHVTCRVPITDVGRVFGRDRTTVSHACAVIEDRRDDKGFDQTLGRLEEIVRHTATRCGIALDLVQ
jgi:chromosomal replication initiation ATPase DnaA